MSENFAQLHQDLNQKYPRFSDLEPKNFQQMSVDAEVDRLMQSAQNQRNFHNNRLMVPSQAELNYLQKNAPPSPDNYTPSNQPKPASPQVPSGGRNGPSSATPPPTPRTTPAATPLNAVEAPPTAAPRTPVTGPNPAPGARPSGIPQPAGAGPRPGLSPGAAGAVGVGAGGVALINNLAAGMPLGKALGGAVAVGAGTVIGGALGSTFGPAGTVIGGYLGGALGNAAFNYFFPPPAQPQPEPYHAPAPFTGGQSHNVIYNIYIRYSRSDGTTADFVSSNQWGPVGSSVSYEIADYGASGATRYRFYVNTSGPAYVFQFPQAQGMYLASPDSFGSAPGPDWKHTITSASVVRVERADGQPDISPNLTPPAPPDPRPPTIINQYINQSGPPRATPAAGTSPPPQNYAPASANPSTANPQPATGAPANNISPFRQTQTPGLSPTGSPSSTGAPNNSANTNPAPGNPIAVSPDGQTVTFTTPGHASSASPWQFPAGQALPTAGNSTGFSSGSSPDKQPSPSGMPQTANPQQPGVQPGTPPANAPAPQPQAQPNLEKEFEELKQGLQDQFDAVLIGLVGATQILQGINNNTTPSALGPTVENAVCRTTQPGGCTSNAINNAANNINANTNQRTANLADLGNLAANAGELGLLRVIDAKLGAQITGGLSGKLNRMSSWLRLPQIVNVLTLIVTLHNAAMLSSALGQTLGSIVSNALAVVGIKDDDGNAININEVLGKTTTSFMESLLGKEVWAGTVRNWQSANTVVRSTANIYNTMTGLFYSARSIGEFTGSVIGKIGNALRKEGVVRADSYEQFPEEVTARTATMARLDRMINKIDRLDDAASAIDAVTSSAVDITESIKQIDTQIKDFKKSVADGTKSVATKEQAIERASSIPNITEADEVSG